MVNELTNPYLVTVAVFKCLLCQFEWNLIPVGKVAYNTVTLTNRRTSLQFMQITIDIHYARLGSPW